jgi:hypothetical protein
MAAKTLGAGLSSALDGAHDRLPLFRDPDDRTYKKYYKNN